jgi:hypothetical protein
VLREVRAVTIVPQDGMAALGKMHTDLVPPPRRQPNVNQRGSGQLPLDPKVGHCRLAGLARTRRVSSQTFRRADSALKRPRRSV